MAKKKAKKVGRPKLKDGPKAYALGIRARMAWKDWLQRFANFRRRDMVDLIDEALEGHADKHGFEKPPTR